MSKKIKPIDGVELANQILMTMDENKTDPLLAYAALGCAFMQLHEALGFKKDDWLKSTMEMANITWK